MRMDENSVGGHTRIWLLIYFRQENTQATQIKRKGCFARRLVPEAVNPWPELAEAAASNRSRRTIADADPLHVMVLRMVFPTLPKQSPIHAHK